MGDLNIPDTYECRYCLQMSRYSPMMSFEDEEPRIVGYATTRGMALYIAHSIQRAMSDAHKGGSSFTLIGDGRSERLFAELPEGYFRDKEWTDRHGLKIRVWDWQHSHEARVLAVEEDGDKHLYKFEKCAQLWYVLQRVEDGFSVKKELEYYLKDGKAVE